MPVYRVTLPDGSTVVGKAKTKSQAVNAVVSMNVKVESLNADETADLQDAGVKIADWRGAASGDEPTREADNNDSKGVGSATPGTTTGVE